jgi:hypothetical protein
MKHIPHILHAKLAFALTCIAALTGGCDRKIESKSDSSPSSDVVSSATASSLPNPAESATAPQEATATRKDPIDALHQRTYTIEVQGDVVHAGTTAGVVTWDYSDRKKPRRLALSVLRNSVNHIARIQDSSLLVVSTGPSGVAIVDSKNAREGNLALLNTHPWEPESRKQCHAAWRFVPNGPTQGYLACGGSGVVQLDLSSRVKPVIAKHANVEGYVRDVAVLDATHVVAAAGRRGLAVVDMVAPQVVRKISLEADVRGVEVRDGLAYVAAGEQGLVVVDVSGPSLQVVGRLLPKTIDLARSVELSGSHAILCLGDSGVAIVDVSDPKQPVELGRYDPKGTVNRTTVSGNRLFLANDSDGIAILDLSNPKDLKPLL